MNNTFQQMLKSPRPTAVFRGWPEPNQGQGTKLNPKLFRSPILLLLLLWVTSAANAAVHYQITLKTGNNHYWVAEGNGGGQANANRTSPGPWETFTLIDHNNGTLESGDPVSIRTSSNYYFVAEGDGNGDVNANRTGIGAWETFTIEKPNIGGTIGPGSKIAFRTGNGHYLRAINNGGSGLDARAGGVGCSGNFGCSHEVFELGISYHSHALSFASGFNGKCLTADPANNNIHMQDCNGAISQLFVQQADGSLLSLMNNYCIDASGYYGNFYLHPCHGGTNQKWHVSNGELRDYGHNQCADIYAFNNNNGANVQMYQCNGYSNQRWHMLKYNSSANYLTAPNDQRTVVNKELFVWSYNGSIPSMNCSQINESANNQSVWGNNYFCTTAANTETGLQYSSAGAITGKRCSHLNEATHSWGDNFLCLNNNSNYVIHWDWANKKGPYSVRFNEPGETYWNDNYLTIGYVQDGFVAPAADKQHNAPYPDYNWVHFYDDVIFDADFYCPLLNFANYLGYAWAGCNNPNIWYDQGPGEYVIQSPQGNGYRGSESLQTRIKNLRVEMDASTISLGEAIISPSSTQQNVKTATYENQGYQEDVQEFRVTVAQQNCWSRTDQFTFGQSISVTGEKKWKTAATETSVSVTLGLSFEQAFSETSSNCSTQSETIVTRVTVPPRSRVTVSTAAITGQVTIPYTAKVNLGYNATFWNFLRWSGNAHPSHPGDRPYFLGAFGNPADASTAYKTAPDAIVDSFNLRNTTQGFWDWNWMFGTYGTAPLKNTLSGVTRKHTRNVNGHFSSNGISYVTTIGAAQPL